ncbi:MAG: 2-amino-4-hydroxy-6-hydroxymethyldihydropteridine diphosphokinase [Gammaproteobacteria bacterium]
MQRPWLRADTRSRRAYVGLGSNLNDPPARLREALQLMAARPGLRVVATSRFYRSAPLGPGGQPDYCNAVCAVDADLGPDKLLTHLHAVERQMGRERPPERWAPRLIDLDLLHYERVTMKTSRITLPHPEMGRRNFVLAPLAELAPELELPGLGIVADLARVLGSDGLVIWAP